MVVAKHTCHFLFLSPRILIYSCDLMTDTTCVTVRLEFSRVGQVGILPLVGQYDTHELLLTQGSMACTDEKSKGVHENRPSREHWLVRLGFFSFVDSIRFLLSFLSFILCVWFTCSRVQKQIKAVTS